jgi:PadR family transcriptional regulator AphA
MLVGRFLTEYYLLVAGWAGWAADIVEQWPDDPHDAAPDRNEMTETLRRANRSASTAVPDPHSPSREGSPH